MLHRMQKHRLLFGVMALMAALAVLGSGPGSEVAGDGSVVAFVPDGDTLHMEDGERVRLLGMDAPEMGHDGAPDGHHAAAARELLAELVLDRRVTLIPGPRKRDRYGRLLARVQDGQGRLVNELLVAQGAAFVYPFPDDPEGLRDTLLAAQHGAMDRGLGFWPRVLATEQARAPWTGNADSRRAFPADSSVAERIAQRHRVSFPDLEAVFRAGFAPARRWFHWPEADG